VQHSRIESGRRGSDRLGAIVETVIRFLKGERPRAGLSAVLAIRVFGTIIMVMIVGVVLIERRRAGLIVVGIGSTRGRRM
jgi:hypothetical protein